MKRAAHRYCRRATPAPSSDRARNRDLHLLHARLRGADRCRSRLVHQQLHRRRSVPQRCVPVAHDRWHRRGCGDCRAHAPPATPLTVWLYAQPLVVQAGTASRLSDFPSGTTRRAAASGRCAWLPASDSRRPPSAKAAPADRGRASDRTSGEHHRSPGPRAGTRAAQAGRTRPPTTGRC